MRLYVFDATDGDCLLIESTDGHLVLIDGGRSESFTNNTAEFLHALANQGRELDAVCVSHIDADHITGVITLLDLVLENRIHDFQHAQGNNSHPKPKFKTPEIRQIWHNGFETMLGIGRSEQVNSTLAITSKILGAGKDRSMQLGVQEWALSERQSAVLSLRALDVLRIPINGASGDPPALVVGGAEPARDIGSLEVTLLAPLQVDLDKLRDQFDKWMRANQAVLDEMTRQAARDADNLTNEIERLVTPVEQLATALNNRGEVTPANLASVMLHVRDGIHTMLLTGDGHATDIARGLEQQGLVADSQSLHVNVLKIPHHGSEFNIEYETEGSFIRAEFLRRVTADHYVFCGNGSHKNPDQDIVKAVIDARVGPTSIRSPNSEAGNRFKLWFTGNPSRIPNPQDRAHMEGIRKYVGSRARRHGVTLKFEFLNDTHFEIDPATPIGP